MSITTSRPTILPAGSPSLTAPRWHADRLANLVADIAARPESWSSLVRFDTDERFALLLDRDDERDLWLLSWLPGQGTGLHDHGGSIGAFAVAQGALRELRPRRQRAGRVAPAPRQPAERRLERGDTRVVSDGTLHDVSNPYDSPAVSLHAYSPPLSTMSYFDEALRRLETKQVHSDVGLPR